MTKDEALRLALEVLADLGMKHYENTGEVLYKNTYTAIKSALEAKDGCQCFACKVAPHASDCAVHSKPAYPAGECNCGAKGEPVAWRWGVPKLKDGTFEWRYSLNKTRPDSIPLYAAPQKQPPVIDKSVARRIATQLGWEPPRKPLTEMSIVNAADQFDWGKDCAVRFARAIEAAHGIKGEA